MASGRSQENSFTVITLYTWNQTVHAKRRHISDSDEEYANHRSKSKSRKSHDRSRDDYRSGSSDEDRKKKKKKKKRYSSSERSSSRGSSLERELGQIKIRDDYVTIPVKVNI